MTKIETVMTKKQIEETIQSCTTDFCKKYWFEQLSLFSVSKCDCGKENKNIPKDGFTYMCKCGKEI